MTLEDMANLLDHLQDEEIKAKKCKASTQSKISID